MALTSRKARVALVLLAAPTGFGILVAASAARHARRFVQPPRARVSQEQRIEARNRLPSLEDVELRTRDGLVLRGWFAKGRMKDAVILVHGLSSNRCDLLPEAEILAGRGHGVLVYDSRASGDSDGDVATWGDRERLDVAAALDFLGARTDVDPTKVGAYGFSVGASAVALVAAVDPRVRAVALGPTWTSLEEELLHKFGKWGVFSAWPAEWTFRAFGVDVAAVRPIDVVHRIPPRPLMLVSGSLDDDTPPAVMERLHRAVPPAERWLVPGAGHGGFATALPDEFARRFSGFFDAAFGSG